MNYIWKTSEQLKQLLSTLVSWDSVSLTNGEKQFSHKLQNELLKLNYFSEHPQYIHLGDAGLDRSFVTAFYRHPKATKTICFISHFDTVGIEEYGKFKELATKPIELTNLLKANPEILPENAREDLLSGNYLFGRGTMDMKIGLALQMQCLERATVENWELNIILCCVPDEEVNSAGMRAAVKYLYNYCQENNLTISLFMNSEPVFTQHPGDENFYTYSGSIGKIMPSVVVFGKETHAGEPFKGITSSYILSYITKEMEFNSAFQETAYGEMTPPPVTLIQKDLRSDYSTQTPFLSFALYNVFILNKKPDEVFQSFNRIVQHAINECSSNYQQICKKAKVQPIKQIQTMTYEDLYGYALKKLGSEELEKIINTIQAKNEPEDRKLSIALIEAILMQCYELAPIVITFFAPPYYPAVNTVEREVTKFFRDTIKELAKHSFDMDVSHIHYFNGICDLSYVSTNMTNNAIIAYKNNTPVFDLTYTIPFESTNRLNGAVFNLGPFGKDAHKFTERLNETSAFEQLPYLLQTSIIKWADLTIHTQIID